MRRSRLLLLCEPLGCGGRVNRKGSPTETRGRRESSSTRADRLGRSRVGGRARAVGSRVEPVRGAASGGRVAG
ncbi:hypothetical protein AB4Z22_45645, partial [Paenibacillus sp. TAF58]